MKLTLFLTLLCALLAAACTTTYTKNDRGGVAYFNTIGGDHTGVTISPDGTHIESMKHSESFKNGTKALEKVMITKALAGVQRNKDKQAGATDRAKSADSTARHSATTNAGIAANNNSTQAAINANNNATRIASEQILADKEVGIKTLESAVTE